MCLGLEVLVGIIMSGNCVSIRLCVGFVHCITFVFVYSVFVVLSAVVFGQSSELALSLMMLCEHPLSFVRG